MAIKTIAQIVSAADSIMGKAAGLQADLEDSLKASKDIKRFRTDLYAAAKAKSDRAYAAVRKMFSRAAKTLNLEFGENRGKAKTAAAAKAKGAKAPTEGKAAGMTDALALARVTQLAQAFLPADDLAIASRLFAAISHKLSNATKSKK